MQCLTRHRVRVIKSVFTLIRLFPLRRLVYCFLFFLFFISPRTTRSSQPKIHMHIRSDHAQQLDSTELHSWSSFLPSRWWTDSFTKLCIRLRPTHAPPALFMFFGFHRAGLSHWGANYTSHTWNCTGISITSACFCPQDPQDPQLPLLTLSSC